MECVTVGFLRLEDGIKYNVEDSAIRYEIPLLFEQESA